MVALTAIEVLKIIPDLVMQGQRFGLTRGVAMQYFWKRKADRRRLMKTLHYLKTKGYIYDTVAGKERYIEVTERGKAKIRNASFSLHLTVPKKWDQRWRIIVFDIPAKWNKTRRKFPNQLQTWGFVPIQRSIYAYPFECRKEINALIEELKLEGTVKYMIADIIEGEEDMINTFVDNGILTKEQIAGRS